MKLISDIYVKNNDENVTDIPNSTSEVLKASESHETIACETIIEVKNLEPAIEETNESIPSIEVDASIVSNVHLTGTNQVDGDCKHLVSSDAVTTDQTPTEMESTAVTIPEIDQNTSILDNVDGKDNKTVSDQLIKGETSSCIQNVPNVVDELEICIESNDQVVVESIGDFITCSPTIKIEIDKVKNDAIEYDQETNASSDQYVSTPNVTIPVKRSISEATTVSRTVSDDLEIKGN